MESNKMCLTHKEKAFNMFRWTNRRYKGITIAYIAMLVITLPLIELIILLQSQSEHPIRDYVEIVSEAAPEIAGSIFTIMAITFTTIYAIAAFSYMHNKRCVDLFGSFPMSRRAMFFSRYFSVLVQTLIPLIVVGIIGAMLTLNLTTFGNVMRIVGILVLGVIGNVSFIALLSLCCGTVIDVIVSFFAINGIYPICILICNVFPESILPGFDVALRKNISTPLYTLLSPLFAPFTGMWGSDTVMYIVWWILFSAVLISGCYFFSKKRKAETAQNSFVFITVEQIIKFFAGFAVGFGLGWIFAQIGASSSTSYSAQYLWFFAGLCIGAFMTGIILHLIYHRGLSRLKISLFISVADIVVTSVFVLVIITGALGYDERVPDIDEVKEIGVNLGYGGSYTVDGVDIMKNYTDNESLISDTIDVHKAIIEKENVKKHGMYPIVRVDNYDEEEYSDEDYYEHITNRVDISYKLKNGTILNRVYIGDFSDKKIQVLKNVSEELPSQISILKKMPNHDIQNISLNDGKEGEAYTVDLFYEDNTVKNGKLKDAIIKDYDTIGEMKIEEADPPMYIFYFYCVNSRNESAGIELPVTKECVNTTKALKELGIKNTELLYLKQGIMESESSDKAEFTGKNERTVYFKAPAEWDAQTEVRALLYNTEDYEFLVDSLESDFSKCEKVKDNLWKYTYSLPKDMTEEEFAEYNKIMFYQILEDKVNLSGCIKLNNDSDNQCLVLEKKKKINFAEYSRVRYQYHWEKLK